MEGFVVSLNIAPSAHIPMNHVEASRAIVFFDHREYEVASGVVVYDVTLVEHIIMVPNVVGEWNGEALKIILSGLLLTICCVALGWEEIVNYPDRVSRQLSSCASRIRNLSLRSCF
jgi:hypothetical protein